MMRPRVWQKQFLILLLFVSAGNPVQAGRINPLPTDTAVGILLGLALVFSLFFLSSYGFLRGISELNKEIKTKSVNKHVFYIASVNYMEPSVSFVLIGIFTFFQTSQQHPYYLLSILTFLSLTTSFLPIEGSKNVQNLISNLRFITILRIISVVFSYLVIYTLGINQTFFVYAIFFAGFIGVFVLFLSWKKLNQCVYLLRTELGE